jgi:hypothetical protein
MLIERLDVLCRRKGEESTLPSSGSGILPRAATLVRNSSIQGVLRNSITPEFMPVHTAPM